MAHRNIMTIIATATVGAAFLAAGLTDWQNQRAKSARQDTTAAAEPLSMTAPQMPVGEPMAVPKQYAEACAAKGCTNYQSAPVIPWTPAVQLAAHKALTAARVRNPRHNRPVANWTVPEEGEPTNCVGCSRSMQRDLQSLFPAFEAAFRLAITTQIQDGPNGEAFSHMVLTIETTDGTFACDCNYSHCLPYDRVTTRWSRREGPDGNWRNLQGER